MATFCQASPAEIYAAGQQAKVPLLVGWNSQEMSAPFLLGQDPAHGGELPRRRAKALRRPHRPKSLRLYPATNDAEAEQSATDLAGDRFIAYSTWKWADVQAQTSGQPVYRYLYARPRPAMTPEMGGATTGLAGGGKRQCAPHHLRAGAVHSAEIEYALGNLATNKVFAWTPDDYQVSKIMQAYFANFIKTGNPNGSRPAHLAAPTCRCCRPGAAPGRENPRGAGPDPARYLFLEQK